MGRSTISMAIFNSYVNVDQRVLAESHLKITQNHIPQDGRTDIL